LVAVLSWWLAIALGGAVLPATAALAGTERPWTMVDADGAAVSGDCDAHQRAYRRIQAAIDAARPGDRIAVCPGVYPEQLRLDPTRSDLRVAAEVSFEAILSPAGVDAAIDVAGARGVWIGGFVVRRVGRVERLPIPLFRFRVCQPVPVAIRIRGGAQATVRGVRITGAPTCGYRTGIEVDRSDATILYDRISNFLTAGITAGPGSKVLIHETEARFLHLDRDRALPGNLLSPDATGIALDGVVDGRVSKTGVFSVPPRGRLQPTLWVGIAVRDTAGRVRIYRTRVVRTIRAGFLVLRASGVQLIDVRTRGNWGNGIEIDDVTGGRVRNGYAAISGRGISLGPGTRDVRVAGLRTWSNRLLDCHDASAGSSSSGTANAWSHVTGSTSDPPGLCTRRVARTGAGR
jgi:hypothetical protein